MIHLNLKTLPVEMLNHKSISELQQLKIWHDRGTKKLVEISLTKIANHY
jgi:hypothetical protein